MRLFLLIVFILAAVAFADPEDYAKYFKNSKPGEGEIKSEISREEVIANMERRKEQLKKMLEETKRRLADHDAGVEKLGEEEREKMAKRAEIIERKLERMDDMDEREIDRQHRREERRWARRRSRGREL